MFGPESELRDLDELDGETAATIAGIDTAKTGGEDGTSVKRIRLWHKKAALELLV